MKVKELINRLKLEDSNKDIRFYFLEHNVLARLSKLVPGNTSSRPQTDLGTVKKYTNTKTGGLNQMGNNVLDQI